MKGDNQNWNLVLVFYWTVFLGGNVVDKMVDPVVRSALHKPSHTKESWVQGNFHQQKKIKFAYLKLIPFQETSSQKK